MYTRKRPSGEYIIYREKPDKDGSRIIYSTNSIFWYCFYTDHPLPGVEIGEGVKLGEKIDWSIVTFNGKVIHRFIKKVPMCLNVSTNDILDNHVEGAQ